MVTVLRIPCRIVAAALLAIPFLASVSVQAQPVVDAEFNTNVNEGTNQLEVTVGLRITPKTALGSATLRFTYNTAALAIPSAPATNEQLTDATDYDFLPVTNTDFSTAERFDTRNEVPFGPGTVTTTNYENTTITRPADNEISVNIVLSSTGSGIPIPEVDGTFTPIVTLFFNVTDPSQLSNLSWRTEGANATVVFEEDNVTPMELGTFTDSNGGLPVELGALQAVVDADAVVLNWATASETNNAGFEVQYRAADGAGDFQASGFVQGAGTVTQPQQYQYRVVGLEPGHYSFRLKQVDFDGAFTYSPEVEATVELAAPYLLSDAYPNPFNPQTMFSLAVRETQHVTVGLYDLLGRPVQALFDGPMEANRTYQIRVDGSGLASGVYLIRAGGEDFAAARRVVLVK